MKAIITVGLGFGDEGKGATVDYLARELGADLVVRYCGGAQAGHNVQLDDGRRHTFSQFGAGTFAGAATYLGPRMIISPTSMVPEAEHLHSLGIDDPWSRLSVHPDCLVATAYHALMNQLRESARGKDRHGSCGMGIGEARHYWLRYEQDAVRARDLCETEQLVDKLSLLRDRFLLEMQELPHLDTQISAMLREWLPIEEAELLKRAAEEMQIVGRMPLCDTVIFEGAQGVLLDEWNGFHPYTTWSTVTPQHALEMLAEFPGIETTVIGITRAYSTRHGAGPFPSWCPEMSAAMTDCGNPRNDWQGAIRFGPLDLVLLDYAARVCGVDGIFVNSIDELPAAPRMVTAYRGVDRLETPNSLTEQASLTAMLNSASVIRSDTNEQELLDRIHAISPIIGSSQGPTWMDRQLSSPAHVANFDPLSTLMPQLESHSH